MFVISSRLEGDDACASLVGSTVPSLMLASLRWIRLLRCLVSVCVVVAHFAALPPVVAKEVVWQIVKVDGRDYLPLENIARFYQLQGSAQMVDHRIALGDGRTRLELGGNPREIYINGVKQWLSFPVLIQNDQVLVSRFDLAKTIEPCLRPSMISNLRPFRTVVIDAGHGGKDRGASSRVGVEKAYTLDVCKDLKKTLEAMGLRVIVTRDDDTFLPLEERADLANDADDAIHLRVRLLPADRARFEHR